MASTMFPISDTPTPSKAAASNKTGPDTATSLRRISRSVGGATIPNRERAASFCPRSTLISTPAKAAPPGMNPCSSAVRPSDESWDVTSCTESGRGETISDVGTTWPRRDDSSGLCSRVATANSTDESRRSRAGWPGASDAIVPRARRKCSDGHQADGSMLDGAVRTKSLSCTVIGSMIASHDGNVEMRSIEYSGALHGGVATPLSHSECDWSVAGPPYANDVGHP